MRWCRLAKARRFCSRHSAGVGLHIEKNEMRQERNLCLSAHHNRHGAKSVAAMSHRVVFTIASWSGHRSAVVSSVGASSKLSQAASFRAQLRSLSSESQRVSLRIASPFAVHRRVVVRLDSAARGSSVASLRSTSLPVSGKPAASSRSVIFMMWRQAL